MPRRLLLILITLILAALACDESTQTQPASQTPDPLPTLEQSVFDSGRTAYGFFPSPSEVSIESVFQTYERIGQHGDVVLLQQPIAWSDFEHGTDSASAAIEDIRNQHILAYQNGIEIIFVADPLNGLNRSEFYNLPPGWTAAFGDDRVRTAFKNYVLRVVNDFHPRYIGLASEINTYLDAHPDDAANYVSLYHETYALIKAASPETQVFVTFQWDDLSNHIAFANEGRPAGQVNWEQVEAFEPNLDVWAISSYPWVAFPNGASIPADYYTPLLERTDKPLAVAEGGFPSLPNQSGAGSEQSQIDYIRAIDAQLGQRLTFWIYLIIGDLNMDSYSELMGERGDSQRDISTLGWFASVGLINVDGTPKPGLQVWDELRE